jgi:hypothetical protein
MVEGMMVVKAKREISSWESKCEAVKIEGPLKNKAKDPLASNV